VAKWLKHWTVGLKVPSQVLAQLCNSNFPFPFRVHSALPKNDKGYLEETLSHQSCGAWFKP